MGTRRDVAVVIAAMATATSLMACDPVDERSPTSPTPPLSPPSPVPTASDPEPGLPTSPETAAELSPPAGDPPETPTSPVASPVDGGGRGPGARHLGEVELPAELGRRVADYGAVPDDGQDDTAALRAALADGRDDPTADYFGRPMRLVFDPGTYEVSDTLQVVGCCVTFQGSGSEATVLQVPDDAAGWGDAGSPRAVIRTIDGNMAFRNFVRDLTIDVGSGNPGAVGLDYVGNNTAALDNLVVRAGPGSGSVGVAMLRYGPGPLLVSDVTVEGFDVGIGVAHREYAPTLQRVTLRDQRTAGIENDGNTLAMTDVLSTNDVPAVVSRGATASVALLDSRLESAGGAADAAAVVSEAAVLLRDVTAPGYASVLDQQGERLATTTVDEHHAGTTGHAPYADDVRTLDLPVEPTPRGPEVPAEEWALFTPSGYNEDKGTVQALFDSGARVVAFPYEAYYLHNVIDVPCSVERVTGFGAVVNGHDGVHLTLRVAEDCDTPLVVEDFGYGVSVDHESGRTVAVRHGGIEYRSTPGAGDAFLENACCSTLTVQEGQRVWARQLNIEFEPVQVVNDGGSLWVLGYKHEGTGVLVDTRGGGRTEVLGGLVYAIADEGEWDRANAAFRATDSWQSVWISGSNYGGAGFYDVYVEETRGGETRRVMAADTTRWRLFSGAADARAD